MIRKNTMWKVYEASVYLMLVFKKMFLKIMLKHRPTEMTNSTPQTLAPTSFLRK